MTKTYITIGIISLIAIGALVFGFSIVGSPTDVRAKEFDKTRLSNIYYLKTEIDSYYSTNKTLPTTLSYLSSSKYSYASKYTKDPETKKELEYTKTSSTSYKLCATFGAPSNKANDTFSYYDFDTTHPKGNYCFKFSVKPLKKTTSPTIYDTPIQ